MLDIFNKKRSFGVFYKNSIQMCRSIVYYKVKPFLKGRCTPGTGSGMKRGGHDRFKTSYALKPTSNHLKTLTNNHIFCYLVARSKYLEI